MGCQRGLKHFNKNSLKKTLLNIKDIQVLKRLKKDGFLPASHNDYKAIRIAIEQNPAFLINFQAPIIESEPRLPKYYVPENN